MKDHYEQLWERLPEDAVPADFSRRLRFLLAHVRSGCRALDVGCGAGEFSAELARAGATVTGVDVAEAALARARRRPERIEFRLVSIDGPLPFDDNVFELVWAGEVIEHVADTAPWLSELRRVLAAGGILLVTTPSHGRPRVAIGGMERFSKPLGDHLHLYTRRSLADLLEEFGFGEVTVRAVGGPPLLKRMLLGSARR